MTHRKTQPTLSKIIKIQSTYLESARVKKNFVILQKNCNLFIQVSQVFSYTYIILGNSLNTRMNAMLPMFVLKLN